MTTSLYHSPLGNILLAADSGGLTGLWFEGQAHFGATLSSGDAASEKPHGETPLCRENAEAFSNASATSNAEATNNAEALFAASARWLDLYFSGEIPDFTPPLHLLGTPFQLRVWALLQDIPYGETVTYGGLAAALHSSARVVGGAVGRNPVSVIVPCHRVLGAGGALTGYAGGLSRKTALLALESRKTARR